MPVNLLEHTTSNIDILEWKELKVRYKKYCIFENFTVTKVFDHPLSIDEIYQSFFHTKNVLNLYDSNEYFDFIAALRSKNLTDDIFKDFKLIEKGKYFDPQELNKFILVLEFHADNLDYIEQNFKNFDLSQFWSKTLRKLLKEFRYIVTPDGHIDYMGHPELSKIHQEVLALEKTIRDKLSKLLNNDLASIIQFNNYDIINDHFVVPIRSDRFNNTIGEIISRSETGNTLYVQPFSLKEHVYNRLQLMVEMQNILYRINLGFNNSLRENFDTLLNCMNFIQHIDEFNSKASFAHNYKLNQPDLVENLAELRLDDLHHPLISNCVVNSINFEGKSLIISGPNTGGKTVSLKSIAICVLMARLGFYTPTTSAKIPILNGVYFLANDNQNLSEGLSSFSAEIKEFTELIQNIESPSLIFIDEIFNSTASDEASVLAVSMFEHILREKEALICVSTHHELLKKILQKNNSFNSCHVGFDFEENAPTYRLHFGIPGSSLAHNIFQKLFKPIELAKKLYDISIQMLDQNKVKYNELLEQLNKKQTILDRSITEYDQRNTEILQKQKAFEGELFLKRQKMEAEVRAKADRLFNKINSILSEVKAGEFQSRKSVEKSLHNIKKEMPEGPLTNKRQSHTNLIRPKELVIGNKYFSTLTNNEVLLKSLLNEKMAQISKGNFTLKCPIDCLFLPLNTNRTERVTVSVSKGSDVSVEHDCRGMRLEEFQNLIENLIPDLLSKSIPYLSIIHGHGDGILKKWIRQFAKNNSEIHWEAGANGNDGETKLTCKNS